MLFISQDIKASSNEPDNSVSIIQNPNWAQPDFGNANSISIQVIACIDPNAQCTYVTKVENSAETRLAIPCDFPVILKNADGQNDYKTYFEQIGIWNTNHPGVNVGPSPSGSPTNSYVEIPALVFKLFPIERQMGIEAAPIYYHVK